MRSNPLIHLGAAYYPEHWPEERWPEDIRLMREAGFTVVRLAEFAWSTLEPAAAEFDFDWLERAIQALAGEGIVTVLGTPTAAPPAWLVQQYPETLAVDENGRRLQFGNRCHYCVNSAEFHEATHRIVKAMAERFGPNPHIIGWQLDNEYNRVCYCDKCHSAFQRYLAEEFGTLDSLNHHWSTRYWSQTYSDWEQIPIPIGRHNPGLLLAFRRFVTHSYRRFQRLQLAELRPHLPPEVWITHNFMGWFESFDHYEMAEELDLVSWDCYIRTGHHDYLETGVRHDLTRGFKQRNFWLMETQPGSVNWLPTNPVLNKGEVRVLAWHAIAHGADAVLYWQWRSAPGGQEQYHGSLLDQSDQPRPIYEEIQQIGRDVATVSSLIAGSQVTAKVALLNSYDSRWSISSQRHHREFGYVEHFNHYYRPLALANVETDVISAGASLDGYKLVVAPALAILGEERAATLLAYVEQGGHLVLTIRTGMKDGYDALLPARQPGPLRGAAGVEVEEYFALLEPAPVSGKGFSGASRLWAERLRVVDPDNTEVWLKYGASNGWLDGRPAVTAHRFGAGMVYYVGAYLDDHSQGLLMDRIMTAAGAEPFMRTPPGVEVRTRQRADGRRLYFLFNHDPGTVSVQLPWPAHDHLTGRRLAGDFPLKPYEVAILTPSNHNC
jgi:beta-galactosidase